MRIETMLRGFDPPIVEPRIEGGDVVYAVHDTPVGPLVLASAGDGLIASRYGEEEVVTRRIAQTLSPRILRAPGRFDDVRAQLDEYFAGRRRAFDVRVSFALVGPFGREVLGALQDVAFGGTTTYAALARAIGRPQAARAVGNALGANPLCVIIPCHRVLREGGALGGYAGGLDAKRSLLDLERA